MKSQMKKKLYANHKPAKVLIKFEIKETVAKLDILTMYEYLEDEALSEEDAEN